MAEELIIDTNLSKKEQYETLVPQIEALIYGETNFIANISNIIAALNETFKFWWIGVYFVDGEELVLGPFQGPIACTRIKKGKGVCGISWSKNDTIIVPDVNQFEGHIACSSATQSEIVLPLKNNQNQIFGVLDIDSEHLNNFDETDKIYLEKITSIIQKIYS